MRFKLIYALLFLLVIAIHHAPSRAETINAQKLVGNWVRPDGGYMLVIKTVRDDGSIEAIYMNPRPITVSKARMSTASGKINVFVELRDVGYPGSYYTLAYDNDKDRLVGVYHHMVLKQNFDIFFVRKKR